MNGHCKICRVDLTSSSINGFCMNCFNNYQNNLDHNLNFTVRQGWQCPICKRVFSPQTFMCYFCGKETRTETSDNTYNAEILPKVDKNYVKPYLSGVNKKKNV